MVSPDYGDIGPFSTCHGKGVPRNFAHRAPVEIAPPGCAASSPINRMPATEEYLLGLPQQVQIICLRYTDDLSAKLV